MKFGAPEIIMIGIYIFALAVDMTRHGESKMDETYNAGTTFIAILINIGLLWWGGFFK